MASVRFQTTETVDFVVVGSGAAGGVIAPATSHIRWALQEGHMPRLYAP